MEPPSDNLLQNNYDFGQFPNIQEQPLNHNPPNVDAEYQLEIPDNVSTIQIK